MYLPYVGMGRAFSRSDVVEQWVKIRQASHQFWGQGWGWEADGTTEGG